MRIAFLGPPGTYTEEALSKRYDPEKEDLISYPTVIDVIQAVEKGECDKGIVPIENSIEGAVTETLDYLAFEADVLVEREIFLEVKHHLIGLKGAVAKNVSRIASHPQASAQCRNFLRSTFGEIEIIPALSTADALLKVAELKDPTVAAIGNQFAAKLYGLEILIRDISDYEDNTTRFIIIGKDIGEKTGYDKTSIVCFISDDRPGSLLEILQEFSYRFINLTKIASRPTKKRFGDYCFFIDMEGHIEDEVVKSALKCLACKLPKVKLLGSYPRSS